MQRRAFLTGLLSLPFALTTEELRACSLAFVNDRKLAKIVVRSMDLPVALPERPKFAPVLALDLHDPAIGGDARRFLRRWKAAA
ncbi:hypothetical protein [Methylocystis iwaonis]|uniref:hypothetical protein n=1 Tax=Methylocystis iwaonis TaxID=2885079 RepID=UPI002E7C4CA6|nr:hypothetical protein [Methylocystis iwaonis]